MRLAELVDTSNAVAATPGRLGKIGLLSALLTRASPDEIEIATAFLTGSSRQGRIGVGGAALGAARNTQPASDACLELKEVDATFERLSSVAGAGSGLLRAELLSHLFGRATKDEQHFLTRLLFGDLRQGALEGVLMDAVAQASGISAMAIRRAAMLAGGLVRAARVALTEGEDGLSRFVLQPFQPIQPMLAESAHDVDDALATLGSAALEYKLDGARIQVHKVGDEVRVYSRNLRDVTGAVPEVVSVVRAASARELILDGEAIALDERAAPLPFQVTMRRFGRRLDVDRMQRELPITPVFFDALYVNGHPLLDEPLSGRVSVLEDTLSAANIVPRLVTGDRGAAAAFAARALAIGHEGVMAKAVDGPYAAGRRGAAWLKVKEARSLDLVILAAEWGSGRRQGWLSNLHLGARDPERAGFIMLGKTFKGLTDEMLAWQTTKLLQLEMGRDGHTVYVRPELVAEIAFNDVQVSSQYPGGLALRFARVKRYRMDKAAADADTFAAVQAIYRQMTRSG